MDLVDNIVELTGLPPKTVKKDIERFAEKNNLSLKSLDISSIRAILEAYLREVFVNLKQDFSENNCEPRTGSL